MEFNYNPPSHPLNKKGFTIFGSGESILSLTEEDLIRLKDKTHLFFINYPANPLFEKYMDVLIWSDQNVTSFLRGHLKQKPSYYLWTRENSFLARNLKFDEEEKRIKSYVDYIFNEKGLGGNYTIVWILALLQKLYTDKTILLFGVDGYGGKWYDKFTTHDMQRRGTTYNVPMKVNQSFEQIKKWIRNEKIYNCNMNSKLEYFPKKEYKEVLPLII